MKLNIVTCSSAAIVSIGKYWEYRKKNDVQRNLFLA